MASQVKTCPTSCLHPAMGRKPTRSWTPIFWDEIHQRQPMAPSAWNTMAVQLLLPLAPGELTVSLFDVLRNAVRDVVSIARRPNGPCNALREGCRSPLAAAPDHDP